MLAKLHKNGKAELIGSLGNLIINGKWIKTRDKADQLPGCMTVGWVEPKDPSEQ